MPIEDIHSFLVSPAKHLEEQPEVSGTRIPLRGRLYEMLVGVFNRSNRECNIEIIFRPDDQGQQNNDCRSQMLAYASNPSLAFGREIAEKLQEVTTRRSGLGLLFIMKGMVNENYQLVISRFPADQGIIAQEDQQNLSVEFIERVFMKNAFSYKSVLYNADSLVGGFWTGMAVDRQISGSRELSEYWIREFLLSELVTTGPAGSNRFGKALRKAIKNSPNIEMRRELLSTTSLLRNRHGQRISARQITFDLGLSQETIDVLERAFFRSDLMDEVFQFDLNEFEKHVSFRSIELNTGGLLIAEDSRFDEVFERQDLNRADGQVRFATEGIVIDEKLRKTK